MSKKYTQLNNLVTDSKNNLHKAYDRGYEQAKKEYAVQPSHFTPEPHEGGIQFRCEKCKRLAIAFYMYCPYCGRKVEVEE